LKPERWGSLLVQENNQEGKACDKRRIIIIIIMAIIIIIIICITSQKQCFIDMDLSNNFFPFPAFFQQTPPIPFAKLHHVYKNDGFGPTVTFDGQQC
jgi:hypothetical protein